MVTYPTAIHLCSGYGGFELALRPWGVRTVCHVERDAYAAAILMERMEEERLDQAPIWDDLTTFDGKPWCGKVDILTAGFPCQPFSNAGSRRGLDDDRWLWPAIAGIISTVRPRFVILENVPPVVRAGLPAVLADFAQLGFDAEWGMLAASDVGAPHRRQRWWCVAHTNSNRLKEVGVDELARRHDIDRRNSADVADTDSSGRPQDWFYGTGNSNTTSSVGSSRNADGRSSTLADTNSVRRVDTGEHFAGSKGTPASARRPERDTANVVGVVGEGSALADTDSARRKDNSADRAWSELGDAARSGDAVADTESVDERESNHGERPDAWGDAWVDLGGHRFPPTRDDLNGWQQWINEGGPEPVVRRLADGPPTGLADALHLGGNGLVPQTATEAIRQLLNRAGWEIT